MGIIDSRPNLLIAREIDSTNAYPIAIIPQSNELLGFDIKSSTGENKAVFFTSPNLSFPHVETPDYMAKDKNNNPIWKEADLYTVTPEKPLSISSLRLCIAPITTEDVKRFGIKPLEQSDTVSFNALGNTFTLRSIVPAEQPTNKIETSTQKAKRDTRSMIDL